MPGRIDNDIKNRFNASLRKYKTFEEYMEANDKKRENRKKNVDMWNFIGKDLCEKYK